MSTLLDERLSKLKANKELAFLPFLVIGDPSPDAFLKFAYSLIEAGADALELGFPFSDPPADGPIIQASALRALEADVTTLQCFDIIATIRSKYDIPISLLVYYNLILQMGAETFYKRASQVGVDAVLVPDLPIELAAQNNAIAESFNVSPVFIATSFSDDERLKKVANHSKSYIYTLARAGVTGVQKKTDNKNHDLLKQTVERLKRVTEIPLLVGFGISSPEDVLRVKSTGADGAIVAAPS